MALGMFAVVTMVPIGICLLLVAVLAIQRNKGKGTGDAVNVRHTAAYRNWPLFNEPPALGVPLDHPAHAAAERLEAALGADYILQIKARVLRKSPDMTMHEWNWTWFELKRYFLMCGIMRHLPMYSPSADNIWHEMLMFTREYEQFCAHFCGEMIHHMPHGPGMQPVEDDRAWFDWVYGQLFVQTPVSGRVWGAFYRTKLSEERLEQLANWNKDELREKWFHGNAPHSDLNEIISLLINQVKDQMSLAQRNEMPSNRAGDRSAYGFDVQTAAYLPALLVIYSMNEPEQFAKRMEEEQTIEQRKAGSDGSYSPVGDSSSSNDRLKDSPDDGSGGNSDSSAGGGDSSSDGGSSCGGGCSS